MTVLRIIDVLFPLRRDSTVALVSIVRGDPKVGMMFARLGNGGRWKVIGVGSSPAIANLENERTLVLSFINCQAEQELAKGQELVECEP
jgi:hypothetical protein